MTGNLKAKRLLHCHQAQTLAIAAYPNIQERSLEPGDCPCYAGYCAKNNLGVDMLREGIHQLRFKDVSSLNSAVSGYSLCR